MIVLLPHMRVVDTGIWICPPLKKKIHNIWNEKLIALLHTVFTKAAVENSKKSMPWNCFADRSICSRWSAGDDLQTAEFASLRAPGIIE